MDDAKRMRQGKLARAGAILVVCAFSGLIAAAPLLARAPAAVSDSVAQAPGVSLIAAAAAAPGLRGEVHRSITRAENSLQRLVLSLANAVVVWSWVVLHGILFLFVAALASVVDVRFLASWRESGHSVGRYLGAGVRTFFGLLVDRGTPNRARLVIAVALLYALYPGDLVMDGSRLTGYVDDLLMLIIGGRLFVRMCPAALVERRAAVVESHLRA
jgi:uncharacterized membrane protein YkvA (DUF1232 family)